MHNKEIKDELRKEGKWGLVDGRMFRTQSLNYTGKA